MRSKIHNGAYQDTVMPESNSDPCSLNSEMIPRQEESVDDGSKGVQRDVPSAPESLTCKVGWYFWSTLCFSRVVHKKYEGTYFTRKVALRPCKENYKRKRRRMMLWDIN